MHDNKVITCSRNNILASIISSASLFLMILAESKFKCWMVNFSCSGSEKLCWSQSKTLWNYFHVIDFPPILRHLGFPFFLLLYMLFLIFFMLCCWIHEYNMFYQQSNFPVGSSCSNKSWEILWPKMCSINWIFGFCTRWMMVVIKLALISALLN